MLPEPATEGSNNFDYVESYPDWNVGMSSVIQSGKVAQHSLHHGENNHGR